ncbi:hypothetical protein [Flavobacterium sp. HNIBRBA15423]|uniref:hypothetical protein n=1 Tax=Flavobacterium sp. HNIBRBA15423 TaxID=3458683 RepID=UPI0040440118
MEKVNQLHKICQETCNTLFKLSAEANSDYWTLYIYRSKTLFRGSFYEVIQLTIEEFLTYRLDPNPKDPRKLRRKYRYLKTEPTITEDKPSIVKSLYQEKLSFARQLGYNNIAEAIGLIGKHEFNKKYKNYENL